MRLVKLIIFSSAVILTGCSDKQKASDVKTYFDIRGFFSAQAEQLQASNPSVLKTVAQNQDQEQKTVKIANWNSELDLFIQSDINKPAWKRSYTISKTPEGVKYLAKEEDLRTREIAVEKTKEGKVKHIRIRNKVNNALYHTEEILEYYPDSLYIIQKDQKVRILGLNEYSVSGKIQKNN